MTRIGFRSSRRADELGVHSLNHFALEVPDLAKAQDFYGAFGLEVCVQGSQLGLHAAGAAQRGGLFLEGPRKRLHHLSFGLFEEDLPGFRQRLEGRGIQRLAPPSRIESEGLWITDPNGVLLELKVAPKSSPDSKSVPEFLSSAAGTPG